jgi:hypothetical protein
VREYFGHKLLCFGIWNLKFIVGSSWARREERDKEEQITKDWTGLNLN